MGADHREKPAWFRSAERQGLVSAMNATKWREATEAMRHLPGGPPRFRMKDIDGTAAFGWADGWDREWYYHPRPYETIEWLEIDPEGRTAQILAALTAVSVPARLEGGLVRIVGWLRPVTAPSAEPGTTADPRRQTSSAE
jgi:hypothetical protein